MIEIKDMEGKVLRVVKDANDLRKAVSIACGEDADLRGADLRGADLRRVNLSGGDLGGANLQNATLQHSHIKERRPPCFKPRPV